MWDSSVLCLFLAGAMDDCEAGVALFGDETGEREVGTGATTTGVALYASRFGGNFLGKDEGW